MRYFFKDNLPSNLYIYLPFLLFPFFLISGPFLPDLLISLTSIIFLIYCIKLKKYNYFNNYYFFLFFVIYLYININSFFSFNPKISFKTSLPYIRFIIFSIFLAFLLKKKFFKNFFFTSFFLSYIILLIDSIIQLVTGVNIFGYKAYDRISSFFNEELILGSFISRTLPFVLGIIFYLDISFKKFLVLTILIISGILIFLSAERVSFAHYIVISFFSFIFFFNLRFKLYFLILIFFFISIISFYNQNFFNRLYFHTQEQLKQGRSIFFLSYRHELHYLTAYRMFEDKKLFGHGLKAFRNLCSSKKYNVQDKIDKDHGILSPIDGFFIISEIYEEDEKSKSLMKYYIVSVTSKDTYIDFKLKTNYIKFLRSSEDYVKKNEKLFVNYEYENGCNTHPHNIYLQILAELGVIGFFLFFGFFLFLLYCLIIIFLKIFNRSITNKDKSNFLFILGIFLALFPLFPSGNLFNNWLLSIFALNLAFLINYHPLIKKKND